MILYLHCKIFRKRFSDDPRLKLHYEGCVCSFYKNTTAGVRKKERWNRTQIAGSKCHDGQDTAFSVYVTRGKEKHRRRDEDRDDANNRLATKNTAAAKSD